jgi:hypothetical protein
MAKSQIQQTLSRRKSPIAEFTYADEWTGTHRTLRYVGDCVVCQRRTWAADDGGNDPRGVMGDHATAALVAEDYDMVGPDVPLCAECGNKRESYNLAMRFATRGHALRAVWSKSVTAP